MAVLVPLRCRSDFVRIAKIQRKWVTSNLVLQSAHTPLEVGYAVVRVGFTVSRKVGNAVKRNRVKRRLRAAATDILLKEAKTGYDLVLIGRPKALYCNYIALLEDLQTAMRRLGVSTQTL